MEMRRLGDLTVSVIGLGCNNFARKIDQQASTAVVDAALDAGINFFDTSNAYGYGDHPYSGRGKSEEFLGKALGARRADVIVATKFGNPASDTDPTERGAKPEYVHKACNDSLRRLGTDYIDVYQIHRPDASTPIAETLGALSELVAAGKIRAAGCSNFTEAQIEEAMRASAEHDLVRFGSVQNEYSLLHREPEPDVLPACVRARPDLPALLPAGQRPAHGQVPARRGTSAGHAPGLLEAARAHQRRGLDAGPGRGLPGLRRGAGPHAARARAVVAADPAGR